MKQRGLSDIDSEMFESNMCRILRHQSQNNVSGIRHELSGQSTVEPVTGSGTQSLVTATEDWTPLPDWHWLSP